MLRGSTEEDNVQNAGRIKDDGNVHLCYGSGNPHWILSLRLHIGSIISGPPREPILPVLPSLLGVPVILGRLQWVENGGNDVECTVTRYKIHVVPLNCVAEDFEIEVSHARQRYDWC